MQMPARTLNTSSYRYGFNGQEKDNEIAGEGNIMTAQFWEYDARIGRRWNLDPVVKSWQSPYAVLSNSPVWKLDPNGDDDFFNANGFFAYRTKIGTNIRIITKEGTKLLSEVLPDNPTNTRALVKIVEYYAFQAGVPIGTNVGVSPSVKPDEALAKANRNGIYVNAKGGIDESLNNYNNLTSALVHENNHRANKDPYKINYTFMDHINVYEAEIDNKIFSKTDSEYKWATGVRYIGYLLGALDNNEISDDEFNKRVDQFNTKQKKDGVYIKTKTTSNGTDAKIYGKNNKGEKIESKIITANSEPQ